MRRVARIQIARGVLDRVLDLPDGIRIVGVSDQPRDPWNDGGYLTLLCEGEALPEVSESDDPPIITPIYEKVTPGDTHLLRIEGLTPTFQRAEVAP